MKQVKTLIAWIVTIPYITLIMASTLIATFVIAINVPRVRCIDRWCITEYMRLAYAYYRHMKWIARFTDKEDSDKFKETQQTMLDVMDKSEEVLALLE